MKTHDILSYQTREIFTREPMRGCTVRPASPSAQVLQPGKQEIVHHLVFPGHGLYKLGMLVDMPDEPVRYCPFPYHLLAYFPDGAGRAAARAGIRAPVAFDDNLPAAVGALAVHKLAFRPEGLAGRAVHPLIGSCFRDCRICAYPEPPLNGGFPWILTRGTWSMCGWTLLQIISRALPSLS